MKYTINPAILGRGHVTATAVSLLHVAAHFPKYRGPPLLPEMLAAVEGVNLFLQMVEINLQNDLHDHLQTPQPYTVYRVPCDVKRFDVQALPWMPYEIVDKNIGASSGLLDVMLYAQNLS